MEAKVKTLKQILDLPYGSGEQDRELDKWYKRFREFCSRESRSFLVNEIWDDIHRPSEVYNACRKYNYTRDVEMHGARDAS